MSKKVCFLCFNREDASLFRFPTPKDPERLAKWANFCDVKITQVLQSYYLCADHFSSSDLCDKKSLTSGRTNLKKNSYPTIPADNDRKRCRSSTTGSIPKRKINFRHECCLCRDRSTADSSYFGFPKDEALRSTWIKFCEEKRDGFAYDRNCKLCNKHFDEDDISDTTNLGGRRILKKNAVPKHFSLPPCTTRPQITKQSRQRCYVCGRKENTLSYFKFPKNPVICAEWISFSGILPEELLSHTKICEHHFSSDSFIRDVDSEAGGRRRLRMKAIPSIRDPDYITVETSNTLMNHDLSLAPNSETAIINSTDEIMNDENGIVPGTQLSSDIVMMNVSGTTLEASYKEAGINNTSSSTAAIGMEEHSSIIDATVTTPNHDYSAASSDTPPNVTTPTTATQKTFPRRLGWIRTPDIETPRRAKRSLSLARECVVQKNRTIKTLKQKISRLQARIKTMKQLVEHLQKDNLITQQAKENLMSWHSVEIRRSVMIIQHGHRQHD